MVFLTGMISGASGKKGTLMAEKRHRIRPISDHNGVVYTSQTALCDAYGITVSMYRNRVASGWPLEKILTTPLNESMVRTYRKKS